MAPQSLSLSSAFKVEQLAATPAQNQTDNGSANNSGTSSPFGNDVPVSATTIPFAVLAGVVIVFVAFLVVSRFAQRMNVWIRIWLGLPLPPPPPSRKRIELEPKPPKPIIWDVCPTTGPILAEEHIGADSARWGDIQPLASWYSKETPLPLVSESKNGALVSRARGDRAPSPAASSPARDPHSESTDTPPPVPTPFRPLSYLHKLSSILISRLPAASTRSHADASSAPPADKSLPEEPVRETTGKSTEAVRVAVFVALPSQDNRTRNGMGLREEGEAELGGEWAIGITEVQAKMDLSALDGA